MNLSEDTLFTQDSAWSVPNTTEGGDGDVYLGTEEGRGAVTSLVDTPHTHGWSLNAILVICLGPLGVVLLVSYIVHWYQVVQKIQVNKKLREKEVVERQHSKVSAMLSIRALERQTRTFSDMAVDRHDEYGIEIIKDIRLIR
eukprot:GFUD01013270.1.p1 GENE.GFUD01013270.1~~GFUD01013270.1.p1  ORF type:complete len:142 (-),score=36.27 GFUD01013270.1:17-442(-)